MDFATRRSYYNRCKPEEPLQPSDSRNVDLDPREGPESRVRGENWVGRLARRIELSDEPVCELYSGLPGSGKSTELRRLAAMLSGVGSARLLPVFVDGEEVLDLSQPVDIPDILAAVVLAAERTVLDAEGKDPADALRDGYGVRLWNWLTNTDVQLKDVGLGAGSANLAFELKTRPALRERVRSTVQAHLSSFLEDVRDHLRTFEARAQVAGYQGLLVVFDSLEKLRGTSTNWIEVLSSAERIFASGAPYVRLPVHVVYTVPPALLLRMRRDVHFMPMIKLFQRSGERFDPGFSAARELVRKRVPDEVLRELLGPTCEERLERLIQWSGGYPRELVRLLRQLFTYESPIADADFERILGEVRDTYRRVIPADAFPYLARVAISKEATPENGDQRRVAEEMFSNNVVLRYLNQQEWFDVHPAVREIPGMKAAIEEQLGEGARV